MDDKIKAKAQELRLALLGALYERIDHARASTFPDDDIQKLAGILNQLDPGAGIGSYATAIDPQELGGVGGYKAG